MSSYGYKVAMKLGLIPVTIKRTTNAMAAVNIEENDTITFEYDSLKNNYYERIGQDTSTPIEAFDIPYNYFKNVMDDILPSYINGISSDMTMNNNSVRGFYQHIVNNLSHLPDSVKSFNSPKFGLPSDIPLVTIRPHYFKTKNLINLINFDQKNFVKGNEIDTYNNNMMVINQYLQREYDVDSMNSNEFTKNILSNYITSNDAFFNFPQLLSFYNEENKNCKFPSDYDYNQNGKRNLFGKPPGNTSSPGDKYRYGSFSNLDAERFECFKTNDVDIFLFSYEFHPHLANDNVFKSVNLYKLMQMVSKKN